MVMKRRAFTLVELLVVIAIIGLLSTVAVVSLGSARAKSRDTKRMADIRQINTAMLMYYNDNGALPNPATLGCSGGDTWYCLGHGDAGSCWQGNYHGCTALDNAMAPYMAKIPDDPLNDTAYDGDSYLYIWNGGNQILHWGLDEVANSNLCLGGLSGQWSAAVGNSHYWCQIYIKP
jgi:prepilin-type N-terminal cleavage/methylation domain-containing protein